VASASTSSRRRQGSSSSSLIGAGSGAMTLSNAVHASQIGARALGARLASELVIGRTGHNTPPHSKCRSLYYSCVQDDVLKVPMILMWWRPASANLPSPPLKLYWSFFLLLQLNTGLFFCYSWEWHPHNALTMMQLYWKSPYTTFMATCTIADLD